MISRDQEVTETENRGPIRYGIIRIASCESGHALSWAQKKEGDRSRPPVPCGEHELKFTLPP